MPSCSRAGCCAHAHSPGPQAQHAWLEPHKCWHDGSRVSRSRHTCRGAAEDPHLSAQGQGQQVRNVLCSMGSHHRGHALRNTRHCWHWDLQLAYCLLALLFHAVTVRSLGAR